MAKYPPSCQKPLFDGHKPLMRNSVIVNEFKKMYDPEVDVTLETSGDISEIRHSIEVIKNRFDLEEETKWN